MMHERGLGLCVATVVLTAEKEEKKSIGLKVCRVNLQVSF
jgi:hypothetical protein